MCLVLPPIAWGVAQQYQLLQGSQQPGSTACRRPGGQANAGATGALCFRLQDPTLLDKLLRRRIEAKDPRDLDVILRVCGQLDWQMHLGPLPQLAQPRCAQGCCCCSGSQGRCFGSASQSARLQGTFASYKGVASCWLGGPHSALTESNLSPAGRVIRSRSMSWLWWWTQG
jgi:hypothetical protein